MTLPPRAVVVEVGPRDGLQSLGVELPVAARIGFIDRLSRSGLPVIEAGAFVSPRWVPSMAGSKDVLLGIEKAPGVRYPVLVPNEQGLDRALEAGAREIALFTAASETFNRRNTNAGISESIERFRPVARRTAEEGLRLRGYVSTCFGCPYEGRVAPEQVAEVVARLDELGVEEFSIGDTIGVADPGGIEAVFELLLRRFAPERLALHAHDTRGTALVNCYRALTLGISIFDASAGGVGGCPYAPGATGNLATEDLVYLLEGLGVATGVDLERLVEAGAFLEEAMGSPLPGRTYQALRAAGSPPGRDAG
jgi:isopropylmalate/homocitrate/citramalate synthase